MHGEICSNAHQLYRMNVDLADLSTQTVHVHERIRDTKYVKIHTQTKSHLSNSMATLLHLNLQFEMT